MPGATPYLLVDHIVDLLLKTRVVLQLVAHVLGNGADLCYDEIHCDFAGRGEPADQLLHDGLESLLWGEETDPDAVDVLDGKLSR